MDVSLLLGGLLLVAPCAAWAQGEAEVPRFLLRPGGVDLRASVSAQGLLSSVEAGVAAEVGVVPLGAATLSLGAEAGGSRCLLSCVVEDVGTEQRTSRWGLSLLGRLGYHFSWEDRNYRRVDLSAVLLAGVRDSWVGVSTPEREEVRRNRAPEVGLGVGGSYFPTERVFVGAEARLRVVLREPEPLRLRLGPLDFGEAPGWLGLLGLQTVFFVGLRL